MKLPEIPDMSAFKLMEQNPPIKLAPGDRFIAQVDSAVLPKTVMKAIGETLLALVRYLPCSLQMAEEALSLSLQPLTDEEKNDIRETLAYLKTARVEVEAKIPDAPAA